MIEIVDCNLCQIGDEARICSRHARCLTIPTGYTCYCQAGYTMLPGTSGKDVQCKESMLNLQVKNV